MTQNQFKIMVVSVVVLFLISCMNMCSSCTTKTALMEMEKKNAEQFAVADRTRLADKQETQLQLQTIAPEVSNSILGYLNAELYKGVIQINNEKIKNLHLQIENLKVKNDTAKKAR